MVDWMVVSKVGLRDTTRAATKACSMAFYSAAYLETILAAKLVDKMAAY